MTTELTPWQRLDRVARARLEQQGMDIVGIARAGGPSVQWFRSLRSKTEVPSARHTPFLERLDRALHWDVGSSRKLLLDAADPTIGPEWLEDFEHQLIVKEHWDESAAVGAVVTERLRLASEEERMEMIRGIRDVLGLPNLSGL